jgi:hypothetical protein
MAFPGPYALNPTMTDGIPGGIVSKNVVLADIVTKTMYVFLTAAALVFVSMLVLTVLHP